ncbi:MAG: hypothetical protein RLO50_12590 [Azospirillaceae bacterium]
MIRFATLFWLTLLAGATTVLFRVSYEVQALNEDLDSLNREIVTEQEAIRVLRAEWSFLNRPERLRELARAYLDLEPTGVIQLVTSVAAVPMPLPGAEYRVPAPAVLARDNAVTMPLPQRRPAAGQPLLAEAPASPPVQPMTGLTVEVSASGGLR